MARKVKRNHMLVGLRQSSAVILPTSAHYTRWSVVLDSGFGSVPCADYPMVWENSINAK